MSYPEPIIELRPAERCLARSCRCCSSTHDMMVLALGMAMDEHTSASQAVTMCIECRRKLAYVLAAQDPNMVIVE